MTKPVNVTDGAVNTATEREEVREEMETILSPYMIKKAIQRQKIYRLKMEKRL